MQHCLKSDHNTRLWTRTDPLHLIQVTLCGATGGTAALVPPPRLPARVGGAGEGGAASRQVLGAEEAGIPLDLISTLGLIEPLGVINTAAQCRFLRTCFSFSFFFLRFCARTRGILSERLVTLGGENI